MNKASQLRDLVYYQKVQKVQDKLKDHEHFWEYFKKTFQKFDAIVNEPLKLAILGEFSSGKSSFINKLLGRDILPVGFTPVTSVITILEYGEEEKIEIVCKDANGNIIKRESPGYDELKLFTKKNLLQSKLELIEILEIRVFVKNDILKFFKIVDTPGFNDPEKTGEIVTEKIFSEVNFVIWIFRADQTGKQSEQVFLRKFREESPFKDNVYALINYGDVVIEGENDYEKISKELVENLKKYFGEFFINDKIFVISCKKELNEFWQRKFNEFKEELKRNVLERDIEISKDQLKIMFENFKEEVIKLIANLNAIKINLNKIFKECKKELNIEKIEKENVERFLEILENIEENFNQIKIKLQSILGNEKFLFPEKILKFLKEFGCYYWGLEGLISINQFIKNHYFALLNEIENVLKRVNKNIHQQLNKLQLQNPALKNLIIYKMQNLTSTLKFLKARRQFLVVGYLMGLIIDNYLYQNLNKQEILNKNVVLNLLKVDFNLDYIFQELENLFSQIEEIFQRDLQILKEVHISLKS